MIGFNYSNLLFFLMRIISQNITNYGIKVPEDAIFRINLAWCNSINELEKILEKHKTEEIFLDLPTKRIKPPNNKYEITDLAPIIESHPQIKYFAVSNVESGKDLKMYVDTFPNSILFVPKIESPLAIENITEIISSIPSEKKIIMLDHDDLFSKLVKNNEPLDNFQAYIQKLIKYCDENKIILLRTIGVIFSDEEKKISGYVR